MKKYILTKNTRTLSGNNDTEGDNKNNTVLYQIQALVSFRDVKKGDLGGWIQSETNLSQEGDAWVYDDACVFGQAKVYGNAKIREKAKIFGKSTVYDEAEVESESLVYDNARIFGNAHLFGKAEVRGNESVDFQTNKEIPSFSEYVLKDKTKKENIYVKMSKIMGDIRRVEKDKKNESQGYKFRGIDDMINALYPCLVRHGVFLIPEVLEESHEIKEVVRGNGKTAYDKHVHLKVCYTFASSDGSTLKIGPIASEGLDSGDKATNKALSAALKYALIQTFSVPTEDMEDSDKTSPEIEAYTESPQQSAMVRPKEAFKPKKPTTGDLI